MTQPSLQNLFSAATALALSLMLAACSGSSPRVLPPDAPTSHTYMVDDDGNITTDGLDTAIGHTITFQSAGSDVTICVYDEVDADTEVLTEDLFGTSRIDIAFDSSTDVIITPPASGRYGFLVQVNPEDDFICPGDDDKGDKPGVNVVP